ncbi:hypothetical protein OG874_30215 [Nocardia sp. NBC_00565]|uniref:hypothetical protein n=1 Tax=Nocardia sp. NBC_00565 TaxID=2975993 RepID=UPI002E80D5F1|nr:hypothetical protein [Nocardia sp. NBC_00565]WUC01076.1 hypothetical protein OG874_30215 [Nocardia sp. NBC_00565]
MSLQTQDPDDVSPLPDEPDVHLSVFLHGVRLDYVACMTAGLNFIQEHRARHYTDAVTINLGNTSGYRRLPCERLYIE